MEITPEVKHTAQEPRMICHQHKKWFSPAWLLLNRNVEGRSPQWKPSSDSSELCQREGALQLSPIMSNNLWKSRSNRQPHLSKGVIPSHLSQERMMYQQRQWMNHPLLERNELSKT